MAQTAEELEAERQRLAEEALKNAQDEQNAAQVGFLIALPATSRCDNRDVQSLPYFSIRDGIPGDLAPLIVRPTVADTYKWRHIQGLHHGAAKEYIDIFIKTALISFNLNRPTDWTNERVRTAAICMGTVRAVTTWMYNITVQDLVPGEVLPSFFAVSPNGVSMHTSVPQNLRNLGSDKLVLSEDEGNLVNNIVSYAPGILPLQGWSLIQTQHHYLSDPKGQSRKAFATVERQFWGGADLKPIYDAEADTIRDILWHKACHPVNVLLKRTVATREATKEILDKMGIGSAAARLPAIETELRAALTWMTVLNTVKTYFEGYNGSLDYSLLEWAVGIAKAMPVDNSNPVDATAVPGEMTVETAAGTITHTRPATVTNRTSAVKWVKEIMDRNKNVVAIAYGFYVAVSEANQLGSGEAVRDTLKAAYSLKKLASESMASYQKGYEGYKDYSAFMARQRNDGKYNPLSTGFL